jgi:cytochrome c oxidase assembly protein subunit 11
MTGMSTRSPNRNIALRLAAVAVGMFGFGFALVPLYDVFCDVMGISRESIGKRAEYAATPGAVDSSRTVRVQFVANNDGTMPWEFRPQHFEMKVHPGASNATTFYAHNPSPRQMVAQAIPSISPPEAAQYFHKTECFCFGQQALESGQALDMPLQFIVDQALPESIGTITLSYTLFDVSGKETDSRLSAAD